MSVMSKYYQKYLSKGKGLRADDHYEIRYLDKEIERYCKRSSEELNEVKRFYDAKNFDVYNVIERVREEMEDKTFEYLETHVLERDSDLDWGLHRVIWDILNKNIEPCKDVMARMESPLHLEQRNVKAINHVGDSIESAGTDIKAGLDNVSEKLEMLSYHVGERKTTVTKQGLFRSTTWTIN